MESQIRFPKSKRYNDVRNISFRVLIFLFLEMKDYDSLWIRIFKTKWSLIIRVGGGVKQFSLIGKWEKRSKAETDESDGKDLIPHHITRGKDSWNWNKLVLIWQGSVPHPGADLRPVRGEHGHLQAGAGAQARPQQHHSWQAYWKASPVLSQFERCRYTRRT